MQGSLETHGKPLFIADNDRPFLCGPKEGLIPREEGMLDRHAAVNPDLKIVHKDGYLLFVHFNIAPPSAPDRLSDLPPPVAPVNAS